MKEYFVWLDLETTGLVPQEGKILEVGMMITTKDFLSSNYKFDQSRVYGSVVAYKEKELKTIIKSLPPSVLDMHTKNSLLSEIKEEAGLPLQKIEEDLINILTDHNSCGAKFYLAGSSVHFDRSWIDVHMKAFAVFLHHRILDVTTFKLGFPSVFGNGKPSNHRVRSDIEASIEIYKEIHSHFNKLV